jgi:hypothetical protein
MAYLEPCAIGSAGLQGLFRFFVGGLVFVIDRIEVFLFIAAF